MKTALLACDVFKDELEALGARSSPIRWLEMGLHDQPDVLRGEIQHAIGELETDPAVEAIVLVYGLCGNGLVGVRAGRCPLVLPRAHDCISVMLGGPARHEAFQREHPDTYFYSPGWIRGKRVPGPDREKHLRELYGERYGDDEELIDDLVEVDRETFARHSCAAYVDLTGDARAESYCRECAQHLGWKFRRLEGDPTLLRDLLAGSWDEERFLVVPPGQRIALHDNRVVAAR